MKTNRLLFGIFLSTAAWTVQAHPGVLRSMEKFLSDHAATCPRTTTPDTMAECARKRAERGTALDRYYEDRYKPAEPGFNFGTRAPAKPGGLCFTRKATGEVVCPN